MPVLRREVGVQEQNAHDQQSSPFGRGRCIRLAFTV
jgi:hypothetical protein